MRTWQYVIPASVVAAFGVYVGVTLHHQASVARSAPRVAAPAQNKTETRAVPAPPASASLQQRESWLMSWQPRWMQREWIALHRPPLRWSPQDGRYYFSGGASGLSNVSLDTLPYTIPWPRWYDKPLTP